MILLSIIIPTKNRYTCLFPVVEAILKFIERDDMEIIIQDNSDDNQLANDYFKRCDDSRCRYFHISDNLSISDNTICAINNASGKYLTFIGDDDLVSPYIMDVIDKMQLMNMEALIFSCGNYWWNSVEFEREDYYKRKNALWIPSSVTTNFIKKDSARELTVLLGNGGTAMFNLPRFYHGVVARKILEKIKEKTGTYLIGSCPDISFATSLSMVLDHFYYVNYPVTIYGASKNSGGGLSACNRHYGKIEEQPFLKKNILEIWDNKIPTIWSAQTIYAETVSEVLRAFNSSKSLNYGAFYASMLIYEPFLFCYLKPVLYNYFRKCKGLFFMWTYMVIKKYFGKVYRDFRFKSKKYDVNVFVASDVDECMKKLSDYKFL